MSDVEDEGIEPIPTEDFLGTETDDGIVIIDTEWEQRGERTDSEIKRG